MMRLPYFRYRAPRTVEEAAKMLAGEGSRAMPIAGGTDLLPNMKRKHQTPHTLVALRRIDDASYGDCLECGDPIAYARLQAQPFASLCIDCQSARETG